jgi:hypothetical protein
MAAMKTPDLKDYLETRLNLLTDALHEHVKASELALHALKSTIEATALAADLRYQQRFDAQADALAAAFSAAKEAVAAALAAQDRAVLKAELAADKRFESVNEFRKTLSDQQITFMPRAEAAVANKSLSDKLAAMKEQLDGILAERLGIKGGWGYAVGVIGFVLAIASLVVLGMKFVGGNK